MPRQLIEEIKGQLVFIRRNRLIRAIALFILIILSVTLIPSIVAESSETRFRLIRNIQSAIGTVSFLMGLALAILTMYHHINSRCIKMVLTKPCLPEWWVLSVFLSTVLVCSCVQCLGVVIATTLSLSWGIPFQRGIIFVALQGIAQSTVVFSWGILLTSFLHPAIALMILMAVQEKLFYWLMIVSAGSIEGMTNRLRRILLQMAQQLFAACYTLIPSYSLFAERVKGVHHSYRVTPMDWIYLTGILGYAMLFAAFCYLVTTMIFVRRRYI